MDADANSGKKKGPAPVGNGGKTDRYTWTQTLSELSVAFPLPGGLRSRDVVVDVSGGHASACVQGLRGLWCSPAARWLHCAAPCAAPMRSRDWLLLAPSRLSLRLQVKAKHIKVGVRGAAPLLDAPLHKRVKPGDDNVMWTLGEWWSSPSSVWW